MLMLDILLHLRMNNVRPENVWIHLLDCPALEDEYEKQIDLLGSGYQFDLFVNPGENLHTLDLRALHAITVHIVGADRQRCMEMFTLASEHAGRVLCAGKDWFWDTEKTLCH